MKKLMIIIENPRDQFGERRYLAVSARMSLTTTGPYPAGGLAFTTHGVFFSEEDACQFFKEKGDDLV